MLYSRCIGTLVLTIEDNLPCSVERRCQVMWKCKFCEGKVYRMVDLKSLERRKKAFPVLAQKQTPQIKTMKCIFLQMILWYKYTLLVESSYCLPSLFLLSELTIQFEVCLLRHSSWHSCLHDFCCSVAKWKINHRISISKSPTIVFADVQLYYWSLLFCLTFIVNN